MKSPSFCRAQAFWKLTASFLALGMGSCNRPTVGSPDGWPIAAAHSQSQEAGSEFPKCLRPAEGWRLHAWSHDGTDLLSVCRSKYVLCGSSGSSDTERVLLRPCTMANADGRTMSVAKVAAANPPMTA